MFDDESQLFLDGVGSNHSSVAAQYLSVAQGIFEDGISATAAQPATRSPATDDVMQRILDLIRTKTFEQSKEPAFSCMGGYWVLRALYRMGREPGANTTTAGAAATTALEVITSNKTWELMLAAGATTTMETWQVSDKSNPSWSHGWCSGPSFILAPFVPIMRSLMRSLILSY